MMEAWGADPFKAMQDHASRNMAMFSDAMKMFNPFAATMGGGVPEPQASSRPAPPAKDDLQALKEQLAAMQRKLDTIADK
jgi:polyhydroxyalkanoate synthesis regulator protein